MLNKKSKKIIIFCALLILRFGMLAYRTYKGGGGSMFTCRDLGCECVNWGLIDYLLYHFQENEFILENSF